MTFSELFSDPAYEPYFMVGLWLLGLSFVGYFFGYLLDKFICFIKRCLKHKDADQQK